MLKQTAPKLKQTLKKRMFMHDYIPHYNSTNKAGVNGKISSGPYGNRFLLYLGLNNPKKVLLHQQKLMDKAEEVYTNRMEIDDMARKHMTREFQESEKDCYEPTPLILRRFIWEAKKRRHFYDRRSPFVEQLLGEKSEDKYDATFRAFPHLPRAQEHVFPESYVEPSIEDINRVRTPEEIENICKPVDTYYSKGS
eukprot:TRINITY_DN16010_c0_g1_i1.p1 TRINITY_DN16010_c0_g1~~TRINITY_DN16010_c0_g1_i1.p1  ORF type:complete len:217 (+),score=35.00 TRINITY_DN16010_c0_g1_i1:67-651(+)